MSTHEDKLQERIKELRGPQTGAYVDMFDMEWPQYDNSKVWFVTNVGRQPDRRQEVIDYLKSQEIEILQEESIFHYIRIALTDDSQWKTLREGLKERFDCDLFKDS